MLLLPFFLSGPNLNHLLIDLHGMLYLYDISFRYFHPLAPNYNYSNIIILTSCTHSFFISIENILYFFGYLLKCLLAEQFIRFFCVICVCSFCSLIFKSNELNSVELAIWSCSFCVNDIFWQCSILRQSIIFIYLNILLSEIK